MADTVRTQSSAETAAAGSSASVDATPERVTSVVRLTGRTASPALPLGVLAARAMRQGARHGFDRALLKTQTSRGENDGGLEVSAMFGGGEDGRSWPCE